MSMTSDDEARVARYIKEFLRDNRQWMARQRLIEKRRLLTLETQRLYEAGKLKQSAAKLAQAERIHVKLMNQLLSPTARKGRPAPGGTASTPRSEKRKKSSRSTPKPSRR